MTHATSENGDSSSGPISFAVPDITDDEIDAVVRVMRSGWITTGDECFKLESELMAYLDAPHVVTMSSCTAALETAFAWLNLKPGARVGVPTWTFVSSALAPMKYGATPVLLPVDEDTLNLSADGVAAALEDGLDALVAVHFGGVPVAKEVRDLCASAGVPVVEDAAHALGAVDDRGYISGEGSVCACLSFYATKNLTSAEGGALVTHNDELADFANAYRLHGLSRDAWARYGHDKKAEYELVALGIKANLPDMLAALARSQLQRFDDMQRSRQMLVQRYRSQLSECSHVRFHPAAPSEGTAHHLVVVSFPRPVERETMARALADAGVATSVHFRPLHRFPFLADQSILSTNGYAAAEDLVDRVLSLPLHPGMTECDVDRVCEVLLTSLR